MGQGNPDAPGCPLELYVAGLAILIALVIGALQL